MANSKGRKKPGVSAEQRARRTQQILFSVLAIIVIASLIITALAR
jgi:hypothetical protein